MLLLFKLLGHTWPCMKSNMTFTDFIQYHNVFGFQCILCIMFDAMRHSAGRGVLRPSGDTAGNTVLFACKRY